MSAISRRKSSLSWGPDFSTRFAVDRAADLRLVRDLRLCGIVTPLDRQVGHHYGFEPRPIVPATSRQAQCIPLDPVGARAQAWPVCPKRAMKKPSAIAPFGRWLA